MTEERIKVVAGILEGLKLASTSVRDLVKLDVESGEYDLETLLTIINTHGVTIKDSKLRGEIAGELKALGYSNRKIAKALHVSHPTILNDLGGKNLPESGKNLPDPQVQKLDDELTELKKTLEKREEDYKKETDKRDIKHNEELKKLKSKIAELQREPDPTEFERQINTVVSPLVSFIQHDNLNKLLSDLENIKEDIQNEADMQQLERVIHALTSLSKRAQSWSERLTPQERE